MNRKLAAIALSALIAIFVAVPAARATNADQEIIFSVKNAPLEVPGHVLLPGQYEMRFTNLEHDVVLITTADGTRPIGFFDVLPVKLDHRTTFGLPMATNVKMVLAKAVPGTPERLKEFFYSDRTTGFKFLYPRTVAALRAQK